MDRKVVAVMTLDPQGAASRWDSMPEDGSYDLDPGGAERSDPPSVGRVTARAARRHMAYFSSTAARQVLTYTTLRILFE